MQMQHTENIHHKNVHTQKSDQIIQHHTKQIVLSHNKSKLYKITL